MLNQYADLKLPAEVVGAGRTELVQPCIADTSATAEQRGWQYHVYINA